MRDTLTSRELEVLKQASMGLSCPQSARQSCHSVETVKYHRNNILRKLRAKNMVQAVSVAYEHGILTAIPTCPLCHRPLDTNGS